MSMTILGIRPKLSFYAILIFLYSLGASADSCIKMHVIDNAPIGYINEQGKPTGTHWDYLTAISDRSGICIKKELLPYARLWENLKNGIHDGGIVFRSQNRDSFVKYVAMVRSLKTVVIPLKNIILRSYEDLTGLIIGKTRGTQLSSRFDHDKKLNKVDLNSYDLAVRMLKLSRLDAIAGSGVVLTYQLTKHTALNEVDLSKALALGAREQWLQLSIKSRYLAAIPKLKQAIEALRKEAVFDEIMTRHYGKSWKVINKPAK